MDASLSVEVPDKHTQQKNSPIFSPAALPTDTKLNEFVVTDVIGEGGFGIVYAAHDTRLKRTVAIKEYMPAAIASRHSSSHVSLRSERHKGTFDAGLKGFIEEARLLAQFKHPALVEILTFWEANGTAYMVMPNYQGETLKKVLKKSSKNTDERWLKSVLGPLLSALELLHSKQIYHRDIAPDNIVIQDNGQPVLLDLGSARRVISGLQKALTVVVKPGYAPIEQYTDDTITEQGPWTDIYALGAVIYFVITGRAPNASVSRMMKDTLPPLTHEQYPNFSDEFLAAVNKALKLQPSERQQSINELRESLSISSALSEAITSLPPATDEKSSTTYDEDDGKTVILSEDEVEALQNKLLAPRPVHGPSAPSALDTDNPLSSSAFDTPSTSASTFDDVKELLDGTERGGNYQMQVSDRRATSPEPAASISPSTPLEPKRTYTWLPRSSKTLKLQTAVLGASILAVLSIIAIAVFNGTPAEPSSATLAQDIRANLKAGDQPDDQTLAQNTIVEAPRTKTQNSQFTNSVPQVGRTATALIPPSMSLAPSVVTPSEQAQATTPIPVLTPPLLQLQLELPLKAAAPETPAPEPAIANKTTPAPKPVPTNADIQPQTAKHKPSNQAAASIVKSGDIKLSVIPWGEIWIDNKKYGVSPPLTTLSLPEGVHQLQIRSPGMRTETRTVEIKSEQTVTIKHTLKKDDDSESHSTTVNNQREKSPEQVIENTPENTVNATAASSGTMPNISNDKTTAAESVKTSAIKTEPIAPWTVNLMVQPWGEVWVDGEKVGIAPPLRELNLDKPQHSIKIVNPSYPTKEIHLEVSADNDRTIKHIFN
ncbi:protein kinase domain-containing protein [Gilvimarinus japonicus]|uniref:non-specific serine/threonine protein kinase n=1 Tax=Gilvimarinus japonicus TaxID=1796469 RepID=A0ABV7HP20_9GAMM